MSSRHQNGGLMPFKCHWWQQFASSHHQQVEGATETLNGTVVDNLVTFGASQFGRTRAASTIISSSIEWPIDSHFGEGHNQCLLEKLGNSRYLFGTVDQLHCQCCWCQNTWQAAISWQSPSILFKAKPRWSWVKHVAKFKYPNKPLFSRWEFQLSFRLNQTLVDSWKHNTFLFYVKELQTWCSEVGGIILIGCCYCVHPNLFEFYSWIVSGKQGIK